MKCLKRPRVLWVVLLLLAAARPAVGAGKVDELSKFLLEDASYKVRVQAALLLGKLGDRNGAGALIKALADPNKTVRAMAAQSLGRLGAPEATDPLEALLAREKDAYVRREVEKALVGLGAGDSSKKKLFLTFGSFSGGTRAATGDLLQSLRTVLHRELGKVPSVSFSLEGADEKTFGKSGRLGFLIDGNVTSLEDGVIEGGVEIKCNVKVMVARWPSKSIIVWTNAGAAVQGGARDRDKEAARRDCLEASAGQIGEDLAKFFQSQGG